MRLTAKGNAVGVTFITVPSHGLHTSTPRTLDPIMSNEYDVLGGHENAEFRQRNDTITVYSTEEDPETGEELGEVGTMSPDELREAADVLRDVKDGADGVEAPEFDDIVMGQHALLGVLMFVAKDEDGETDSDRGIMVPDPDTVIDAAESLDE